MGRDEEHATGRVSFISRRDGVDRPVRIDWDLITSGEYRAMASNREGREALRAGTLILQAATTSVSTRASKRRSTPSTPAPGRGSPSSATRASAR